MWPSAKPDKSGSDKSGSDKSGSDKSGCDKSGSDKSGCNLSGCDKSGCDKSDTQGGFAPKVALEPCRMPKEIIHQQLSDFWCKATQGYELVYPESPFLVA
jgi:uncharacterized protein YjbI with pentapeptide repeats